MLTGRDLLRSGRSYFGGHNSSGARVCKPRRQIDGAAFGPETVKALGHAFDQAWAEIAGNFGTSPIQIENARLRLAEAMLSMGRTTRSAG